MSEWLRVDFWHRLLIAAANWFITSGPTIIVILILALVLVRLLGYALAQLQDFMIRRAAEDAASADEVRKSVVTLTGIVRKVAKVFVWVIVTSLILRELGVDIAPIIAGAGIAGIAVGFGAQNLVRDVISGFFLIMENHVRAGDVAVINGTAGLVESISLRTIVLRDDTGTVHVFQNGAINSLSNRTMGWSASVHEIAVSLREDPDEVMQVIRDVGEDLRQDAEFAPWLLEPIEVMGVDNITDAAVIVKVRLKTPPGQQWNVGREFRRRLKKTFDARGIDLPQSRTNLLPDPEGPPLRVQVETLAAAAPRRAGDTREGT